MKLPTSPRRWRVYYSWRGQWPNLAALDQGTVATQVVAKRVVCDVPFTTQTDMRKPGKHLLPVGLTRLAGEDYIQRKDRRGKPNEPTWWIEVYGVATIDKRGTIHIREGLW